MGLDADLQILLDRLAQALMRHEDARRALLAAAERAASNATVPATRRALQRCEVFERRAALHVEIARANLARRRAAHLDDLRRVPAAFRRVPPRNQAGRKDTGSPASVQVVGTPVPRPAAAKRVAAARDRAAS